MVEITGREFDPCEAGEVGPSKTTVFSEVEPSSTTTMTTLGATMPVHSGIGGRVVSTEGRNYFRL